MEKIQAAGPFACSQWTILVSLSEILTACQLFSGHVQPTSLSWRDKQTHVEESLWYAGAHIVPF